MTITDEEVAALKAKAEAATAGPWVRDPLEIGTRWNVGTPTRDVLLVAPLPGEPDMRDRNSDYVAAANPTAILALIERASGQGDDTARLDWLDDPENSFIDVARQVRLAQGRITTYRAAIDAAIRNADREGT